MKILQIIIAVIVSILISFINTWKISEYHIITQKNKFLKKCIKLNTLTQEYFYA